ncbi:MAG TPA: nucleotidyltransferase family protein [Gemmatimonadaceae bacterium]
MTAEKTDKVVILARGLGTRMRKADDSSSLRPEQSAAADIGLKAMIPIGRPFLDYVLSALADAGFTDVCLVIGPEHTRVRDYYEREVRPSRLRIRFAIQEKALGTANAVLAAEEFAGAGTFAVINSDNFYPMDALTALHNLHEPAIVGFERNALVHFGNVPVERTARFGALDIGEDGYLRRILVTPTEAMVAEGAPIYASMNCFLFTQEIFSACREVPLSARGEYELPKAVQLAIEKHSMRFKVVKFEAAVLDLSSRADITTVTEKLRGTAINL